MSEGVPWTPNFQPGVQKNVTLANSYGQPPPVTTNAQRFPAPFPHPGAGPGLNNSTLHQNPIHSLEQTIRPPQPLPSVPNIGAPVGTGLNQSPFSSASNVPGTGSSVFSQPHTSNAINGPLLQAVPATSEASNSNLVPPNSVTSSVSGVSSSLGLPNTVNPQNTHSLSGSDKKYSHPLPRSANSRPISSNDASPTPSGGLPLPYNGMAQYTHPIRQDGSLESSGAATPTHGNQRSYQPSPVSTPQIDAIEGQFSLQKQKQHSSIGNQGTPPNAGSASHSRSGSNASANQFPLSLPGFQQQQGSTGAYQTAPPPPNAAPYQSQPPHPADARFPAPHSAERYPGNQRAKGNLPPQREGPLAPSKDPMSMPPSNQPGMTPASSQMGPSNSGGSIFPPSRGPSSFPNSIQPGFPPLSGPQRIPATSNQVGFPPPSGQVGFPPRGGPTSFPPPSGQAGLPSNGQPGAHPASQPGFPPFSAQPGFQPPSGPPGLAPSTSQPGFHSLSGPPSLAPPTNHSGLPSTSGPPGLSPPMNQPGLTGFPPPSGPSRFAPPTSQPGFPPPSGPSGFAPPTSQPGFPPPGGPSSFPPSSQPGLPNTGNVTSFPPNTGQQGPLLPPSSTGGRMPPGGQVGPPSAPGPPSLRPPGQTGGMGLSNSTTSGLHTSFSKLNLGPNRIVNLLQERVLIPAGGVETVKPHFGSEYRDHSANCAPEIMRCTLNSLPQTSSLLNKARLPLGLHLHPFRDLSTIPVIQASVIVRCKSCRTYINPFVVFLDQRRWRCNICFRQNEVPNEFQFDPVSRQYGDPQRRPEVKSATVEFIAPSEYMLRPPQPAVYLFVLDVSRQALSTGYLSLFCHTLLDYLERLPGDSRTHIGLITFNSGLQFYKLDEERGPRMLLVNDIEDVFLPDHSGLVVNLGQHRETVEDLLNNLPESFKLDEASTGNCLGAALQAALKLVGPTGGRVTVLNCGLPESGPGALKVREDPNQRAAPKSVAHLGPATDFYKALALECAGQQVAVDLFLLTNSYADFATVLGISRHSGGGVRVYPNFSDENVLEMSRFRIDLRRYFSRKIGFEAVMRVRCTRGLAITAFYGNFFVRSTDLLSLPNVSPDAGYTMQIKIEDSLTDLSSVSFQAALLYTSSKGERRIRVHTLTVPTTGVLEEVFRNADHCAVACLLAKMAAERSVESGIREAREALVNAVLDVLKAYGDVCLSSAQRIGSLGLPYNLRLLPLLVLSLLKSRAFRLGVSTKLDDRVAMMEMFKSLPPSYLLPLIYPRLFLIHTLAEQEGPPTQLHASAQFTERTGSYLLDAGEYLFLLVGKETPQKFISDVFGVSDFQAVPDGATELPERDTPGSERLRQFVFSLRDERPIGMPLLVMKDDSRLRALFSDRLMDDRSDQLMAYTEFLQYLQSHVKYSS